MSRLRTLLPFALVVALMLTLCWMLFVPLASGRLADALQHMTPRKLAAGAFLLLGGVCILLTLILILAGREPLRYERHSFGFGNGEEQSVSPSAAVGMLSLVSLFVAGLLLMPPAPLEAPSDSTNEKKAAASAACLDKQ